MLGTAALVDQDDYSSAPKRWNEHRRWNDAVRWTHAVGGTLSLSGAASITGTAAYFSGALVDDDDELIAMAYRLAQWIAVGPDRRAVLVIGDPRAIDAGGGGRLISMQGEPREVSIPESERLIAA